jgi:hypothetical protein
MQSVRTTKIMDASTDTVWIFAGTVIAALIVLFSGWLQQYISRASIVSGYRQKWIQDIRAVFLKYLEQLDLLADKGSELKESNEKLESISEALSIIRPVRHNRHALILFLNPREKEHKQLIKNIDVIESYLLNNPPNELNLHHYETLRNSLVLEFNDSLKEEWNRVKKGEALWKLSRLYHRF